METSAIWPMPRSPAYQDGVSRRLRRSWLDGTGVQGGAGLSGPVRDHGIAAIGPILVGGSLGTEIFPIVDTGQLQLHLRAPAGTRIERTEQIALQTLDAIKREVGPDNVAISLGFVGTQPPNYPINTIYLWSSGSEEAVLQVQLRRGAGIGIEDLKERLRRKLLKELPSVRFSFEPSDIVSRVMSFGAPTPIEVAVSGPNLDDSRRYADKLRAKLAQVPTLRDLSFEQELEYPTVKVIVDRERAGVLGVTTDDVAKSVVAGTSSSRYTSANYWPDPKSGIGYQVQVEIPEQRMNSLEEVKNLPIVRRSGQRMDHQIDLRNVADVTDGTALGEYDRYNMQRMLTLSADISGEDLGRAAVRVEQAISDTGKPPDRVDVTVRGQVQPMAEMFGGLRLKLVMAMGVILLLLAANFQSFRLSLSVGLTIPAVIAGVVLMFWITRTTLNIQSFMGAIMAIGVAVANAILLVTFAERSRVEGREPWEAAIEGARSRLRPILMTSFAMLAGMVPMALGLGEGGEQTAPLGRAVIGGLLGATCVTLIILPAILATLQSRHARISASLE
jgi:multidrug efflux pump subunit AcrB